MSIRPLALAATLFCAATLPSLAQSASNFVVRINTTAGNLDVVLFPTEAPKTVANFLRYVNSRFYTSSFFHRSVSGFVIQGGGFGLQGTNIVDVPTFPDIASEAQISNTRGTLAMALSSGPATGNSEWFFNEGNNSAALDGTVDGGPFTVFGKAADSSSLAVMDAIAADQILDETANLGAVFSALPVVNYNASAGLQVSNLVVVNFVTQLNPPLYFQNGLSLGALTLNTTFLPKAWQGVGTMGTGWQERAVADINGDGIPDIIFQNGTLIGALTLSATGTPVSWIGIGSMGTGWQLRAAADINFDGRSELIFQNGTSLGFLTVSTSGAPVAWTGIGAVGSGWQLHAVADLNADGQPELLFQNGTLIAALEISTAGVPTAWHGIGTMGAGWTLSAAVDLNADGQPDLVFQNGTLLGALSVSKTFSPAAWTGIGTIGSGWTLPGDY